MIYLFIGIIIGVITASSVLFVNLMTFYLAEEKFIPRSLISYARGGRHKRLARKHIQPLVVRKDSTARKVVKLIDENCKLKTFSVAIERRMTVLEETLKGDRELNMILNRCLLQAVARALEIKNDRFGAGDSVTKYKLV